jgi:hypothetical protein
MASIYQSDSMVDATTAAAAAVQNGVTALEVGGDGEGDGDSEGKGEGDRDE